MRGKGLATKYFCRRSLGAPPYFQKASCHPQALLFIFLHATLSAFLAFAHNHHFCRNYDKGLS
jgi:hypothetical protein